MVAIDSPPPARTLRTEAPAHEVARRASGAMWVAAVVAGVALVASDASATIRLVLLTGGVALAVAWALYLLVLQPLVKRVAIYRARALSAEQELEIRRVLDEVRQ